MTFRIYYTLSGAKSCCGCVLLTAQNEEHAERILREMKAEKETTITVKSITREKL